MNSTARETRITPIDRVVDIARIISNEQPGTRRDLTAVLAEDRRINLWIKTRSAKLADANRGAPREPSVVFPLESSIKIH